MDAAFEDWIRELEEDVVQGEYGYEAGEYIVYPAHWERMFLEGLTPAQAFRRALDAHAEQRRIDEEARAENWRRIQAADAALPTAPTLCPPRQ